MTFGAFRLNTLSAAMTAGTNYVSATGGTLGYYADATGLYRVHTFSTAGSQSFIVTATGNIDALIIGGGGASAAVNNSGSVGGAGGGQVQTQTAYTVTPQTYSLTIGAGAPAPAAGANDGGAGSSTVAFGFTSVGGAGSTSMVGTPTSGGAAGGAGGWGAVSSGGTAGPGTFAGGTGSSSGNGAAGGGGSNAAAGANGGSVSAGVGGLGANGPVSSITGTSVNYAGGGGGGGFSGTGANGSGTIGQGGRGKYTSSGSSVGLAGTAGGVIIRYPLNQVQTYSFVSSTTFTTSAVTMPTVQNGDVAVMFSVARNTTTTIPSSPTTPSGWTLENTANTNATTNGARHAMYTKICSAADTGASYTLMTGTQVSQTMIIVYRPATPVNEFDGLNTVRSSTGASAVTSTTVTTWPANNYMRYIGFIFYTATGTIATRGSVNTATRELNIGTNFYVKTFESTTSSTTFSQESYSMSDGGDANMITALPVLLG